ncbi:hypothetical protein [Pandoraea soli]
MIQRASAIRFQRCNHAVNVIENLAELHSIIIFIGNIFDLGVNVGASHSQRIKLIHARGLFFEFSGHYTKPATHPTGDSIPFVAPRCPFGLDDFFRLRGHAHCGEHRRDSQTDLGLTKCFRRLNFAFHFDFPQRIRYDDEPVHRHHNSGAPPRSGEFY